MTDHIYLHRLIIGEVVSVGNDPSQLIRSFSKMCTIEQIDGDNVVVKKLWAHIYMIVTPSQTAAR